MATSTGKFSDTNRNHNLSSGKGISNPVPDSQPQPSLLKNHDLKFSSYKEVTGGKTTGTAHKK